MKLSRPYVDEMMESEVVGKWIESLRARWVDGKVAARVYKELEPRIIDARKMLEIINDGETQWWNDECFREAFNKEAKLIGLIVPYGQKVEEDTKDG